MKPSPFDYARPDTLDAALDLMDRHGDGAALIAGGQSLVPLLALRMAPCATLLDISRLAVLRETRDLGDKVFLGAGLTHAMFEDGEIADPANGLMRRAAGQIAYRAIRCQGTLGGSVAMADPAADWPAVLLALDAVAVLRSSGGERRLALDDLLTGTYTTALEPGELILGFEIRKLSPAGRGAHVKFSKKVGAFATSLAVAVHEPGAFGRVVLAGAAGRASILPQTSARLEANAPAAEIRACIEADIAGLGLDPDPYAHALHAGTVTRAIDEVLGA